MSALPVRAALDWGGLARRGAGVEFGGHREYAPGDDLRWLDRRSLLRHERLLVRQFETETDRALRLVIDATSSMAYRGQGAPGAKLAFASLVAAALARIAIASGDPVGLTYLGGGPTARGVPVSGGREAFERILGTLEAAEPGGDAISDPQILDRALGGIARTARRGSIIVVLSDLLDLPEGAADRIAAISSRGRVVSVVQTLDPDEARLPFEGTVRLRSLEGGVVVETDIDATRERYLESLRHLQDAWERALVARGGRLVRAETSEDAVRVVRAVVEAVR
jgi:uncharacterized protein (DUF58 family)